MAEAAGDPQQWGVVIYILGAPKAWVLTTLSIIENVLEQMEVWDLMCILSDALDIKGIPGTIKLEQLSHRGKRKKKAYRDYAGKRIALEIIYYRFAVRLGYESNVAEEIRNGNSTVHGCHCWFFIQESEKRHIHNSTPHRCKIRPK